MRIYHGSKNGIEGDIKPSSRIDCDFGAGFYMSESKHLCEAWVSDNKFENPKIYELEFSDNGLKTYKFDIDRDWYLHNVAKTKNACKNISIISEENLSDEARKSNNAEVEHRLESIKDVVEQVRVRYRSAESKYFDEILEEF